MALDKEKLAAMMNEDEHVRPSATVVPMVMLEGNKGVFTRREVGEDGYDKPVEIGQTFSGVIVGVRMSLSQFEKKFNRSTPEYSKTTDKTVLFEKQGKDGKNEKIAEGTPNALKAKYPELREQRWLYMLVGGKIVKLKVKGAGMTHWFKFLRQLSAKKLHTFQVEVKLDPGFETNEELGKEYYAPTFTIAKELSDEDIERLIQPHIEKFSSEFAAIAAFRAQREQAAVEETVEDIPVIQIDEEEVEADEEVPL
jgi:hypothetical protein